VRRIWSQSARGGRADGGYRWLGPEVVGFLRARQREPDEQAARVRAHAKEKQDEGLAKLAEAIPCH
jgi:hypothetical protein